MKNYIIFGAIILFEAVPFDAHTQMPPQQAIYYQEAQQLEAQAARAAQSSGARQALLNAANQNGNAARSLNSSAPIIKVAPGVLQAAPGILNALGNIFSSHSDSSAEESNQSDQSQQQQLDQRQFQEQLQQQQLLQHQITQSDNLPDTSNDLPSSQPVFNSMSDQIDPSGSGGLQTSENTGNSSGVQNSDVPNNTSTSQQTGGNASSFDGVLGVNQDSTNPVPSDSDSLSDDLLNSGIETGDTLISELRNGSVDLNDAAQNAFSSITVSGTIKGVLEDKLGDWLVKGLPEGMQSNMRAIQAILPDPKGTANFKIWNEDVSKPINQITRSPDDEILDTSN